jgi:enoyl-CoA hydratase/carnithine racemase
VDGLHTSVDGAVARVTLDRPEVRNAQTPAMWLELARFGASLPDDIRVVVVTGTGTSFSSGIDLSEAASAFPELGARPAEEIHEVIAGYQAGFSWLRDPRFVSIAAVHGHAIGAGFQLALACDLRVLTPEAQFAMREPSLGLVPDLGGTQPLVDLIGYSRALEICATTRWVHADEAAQLGLATLVVPVDQLAATVDDLVAALVSPPVGAVRETKELLLGASRRTYDEQLRAEREAQARRLSALLAESRQA